ncbi:hypothetical protein ALP03_03563 [Pseudomonas amygdali pv. tabaci]|uniref:HTH lysR-type domain-containing protein n=1 Tax=Pseudomonas amygdali pv. tabaci TaxID=322 RepID=A0A3M6GSB5_PSEAJ|nr:hypothetical protein ALP03_03563 [Pseudomonas amygdali pv. tabaci]
MNQTQDLSFFHLLAQQGSLAATARELGVTPPAISKRLSLLEARLGTRLVNRTTRSMSLTAEGELYFSHAARILTQIDEVEQLITSSSASPKGLIRVNASLGFGRRHAVVCRQSITGSAEGVSRALPTGQCRGA